MTPQRETALKCQQSSLQADIPDMKEELAEAKTAEEAAEVQQIIDDLQAELSAVNKSLREG